MARARARSQSRSKPSPPRSTEPGVRGLVAVVERRGKFLVGDLVLVTPGVSGRKSQGSRARVHRRIGRPTVARDVIEALMLDRGLARGCEPPVARPATDASAREVAVRDGRRDLRELATFTIDPTTAKDFD